MAWQVTAGAIVINVGSKAERYLYRGTTLPDSISPDEIARLSANGLITESRPARGRKAADPKPETPTE